MTRLSCDSYDDSEHSSVFKGARKPLTMAPRRRGLRRSPARTRPAPSMARPPFPPIDHAPTSERCKQPRDSLRPYKRQRHNRIIILSQAHLATTWTVNFSVWRLSSVYVISLQVRLSYADTRCHIIMRIGKTKILSATTMPLTQR